MQTFRYAFCGLLAVAAACSNSNSTNDGGTDSGNGDGGNGEGAANTVNQTGQIVDYSTHVGIPYSMVVSGGGATVNTDMKGNYTLAVAKNTPYSMQVYSAEDAGTSYLTLNEQEWMLSADSNRGATSAVSNGTETLLKSILQPAPNQNLAVLTISVYATGSCASATGATISVPGLVPIGDAGPGDGGGDPITMDYFAGGFPSTAATSVTDGQLPSAIIWNLPITASYNTVTVTPPAGCTVKAFPTSDPSLDSGPGPTLVYTGNVKLQATQPAGTGTTNVASFMRVFLE